MTLLIKICGLKSHEMLDVALECGADMVGFVFFRPSPRNIELAVARSLSQRVRGRALKVALSVDAGDQELDEMVEALKPDLLQLHGRETPERLSAIRRRFALPIMKALPIAERADLRRIRSYETVADRLIFDARAPANASRPGGLGRSFDWQLLRDLDCALPFMLSGGLDAENVGEAVRITQADGVDVSSGIERAPGEKDAEKIHAFIAAARQVAREQAIRVAS